MCSFNRGNENFQKEVKTNGRRTEKTTEWGTKKKEYIVVLDSFKELRNVSCQA